MSLKNTLKCPSCRRAHQVDPCRQSPAVCARCGCELEILICIRESATALLAQAWQELRSGDKELASEYVEYAWMMTESKEIAELGFVASVLCEDLSGIKSWRKRLSS